MELYDCIYCTEYGSLTEGALRIHVYRHHSKSASSNQTPGSPNYIDPRRHGFEKCLVCDLTFEDKETLISHKETSHHMLRMNLSFIGPPDVHEGTGVLQGRLSDDDVNQDDGNNDGIEGEDFGNRDADRAGQSSATRTDVSSPSVQPPDDYDEAEEWWDWLDRPHDKIDFKKHFRMGEVYLIPLNCESWETEAGVERGSQHHESYARYRVVDVDFATSVMKNTQYLFVIIENDIHFCTYCGRRFSPYTTLTCTEHGTCQSVHQQRVRNVLARSKRRCPRYSRCHFEY